MTPPDSSQGASVVDAVRAAMDAVRVRTADEPRAIVLDDNMPDGTIFGLATTMGRYLLIHPSEIDKIPKGDGDRGVTAIYGLPVIDRLPEEAMPLGVDTDWRGLHA